MPNLFNLSLIFLMNTQGDWGSIKHPNIHGTVQEYKEVLYNAPIPSVVTSLLVFLFLALFSHKNMKSIKPVIIINGVIYLICTSALFVFAFFLSGLASQGAGQ